MAAKDSPPPAVEDLAGKGRPTPKRSEREAARKRPLIVDPKASNKERREREREQRAKENQALLTGDERHMPAEHKGPDRRFIRDWIDARTSLAEFLMPMAIIFVVASLATSSNPTLGTLVILGFYVLVLIAAVDTYLAIRRLGKRLEQKFGVGKFRPRWRMYAASRMLNLRRLRVPRPQVRRGESPV